MIVDIELMQVAYKKLKQMVFFEKHPLFLRDRLAELEQKKKIDVYLADFLEILVSDEEQFNAEFKKWSSKIDYYIIPKGGNASTKKNSNQGTFVSNISGGSKNILNKVNYLYDGPIETHLISILWILLFGQQYDRQLSRHCFGGRLHQYVGEDEDKSAHLFVKYHELYKSWRDLGIERARELLSGGQNVCLISLDIQEYYYRIELNWDQVRADLPQEYFRKSWYNIYKRIFFCLETICSTYKSKIQHLLNVTHPDLSSKSSCLPIGLSASPILANWYLKSFDGALLQEVMPTYYGRYVDDMLIVLPMSIPPEDGARDPVETIINKVFVRAGILKKCENQNKYEINKKPGLFLQKDKCVIQYFDAEYSTAGLEKFQKEIEDNASDFALLPVDGDESPVAQVAYDLLYDGSVNKFRNIKAIAENRWELARHLSKQAQLHILTRGVINEKTKREIFQFFKGKNAIDYWDMWERVVTFFILAGSRKDAFRFSELIRKEIGRVEFAESEALEKMEITELIQHALSVHMEHCLNISLALVALEKGSSRFVQRWRDSNLMRHHLVAVPLLNYTRYEGSLVDFPTEANLEIDPVKAKLSPRYIRYDECVEFVNYVCFDMLYSSDVDALTKAQDIFKVFHGYMCEGVSTRAELVNSDE